MSTEENKALVRRIFDEIMNERKLDVIDELFADDYVFHGPGGHEFHGKDSFKQFISRPHTAYPDFHLEAEDMLAEGDKVVCRFTSHGTHKGPLGNIPPTGKQIDVTGMVIYRIDNGKVTEHWENLDMFGAMQQLGVIPSPEQGKK